MTEAVLHDPRKGCKGCESYRKTIIDGETLPSQAQCLRTGDAWVGLNPSNIHIQAPYWCPKWREKKP